MDRTVIILICAGVVCAILGLIMFIRLLFAKSDNKADDRESIVAEDYADNFRTCFSNTGNIEETLEQLVDIYSGNKQMLKLINGAVDYIQNGYGDYETALESINVDGDEEIEEIHNEAIHKALGADDDEDELPGPVFGSVKRISSSGDYKRIGTSAGRNSEENASRRRRRYEEDESEEEDIYPGTGRSKERAARYRDEEEKPSGRKRKYEEYPEEEEEEYPGSRRKKEPSRSKNSNESTSSRRRRYSDDDYPEDEEISGAGKRKEKRYGNREEEYPMPGKKKTGNRDEENSLGRNRRYARDEFSEDEEEEEEYPLPGKRGGKRSANRDPEERASGSRRGYIEDEFPEDDDYQESGRRRERTSRRDEDETPARSGRRGSDSNPSDNRSRRNRYIQGEFDEDEEDYEMPENPRGSLKREKRNREESPERIKI